MKKSLRRLCNNTRTRTLGVIVAIVVAVWSANSNAADGESLHSGHNEQQQGAKECLHKA